MTFAAAMFHFLGQTKTNSPCPTTWEGSDTWTTPAESRELLNLDTPARTERENVGIPVLRTERERT